MAEERRGAERFQLPEGIEATINGAAVRLLELSTIGARIEHEERIPLNAPQMRISWRGASVALTVKIARAEIAGRRGSSLIYQSGIRFVDIDRDAEIVIASILGWAESAPPPPKPPVVEEPAASIESAAPRPERPSLEDSWTRSVRFFKDDLEEDLPYAQFRLTESGWEKNYVASPEQPEDGFTIARGDMDFAELQKTFEVADPETRRMMQIALEAKLVATR